MPQKTPFVAQTTIMVNGVRGYNAGDPVPASAVENLGLIVGRDVLPADRNIVPRPAANAKRADWVAYWLGQRLPQDEVDDMTRDEMAAREPVVEIVEEEPPPVVVAEPANPQPDLVAEQAAEQVAARVERPGQNARKPEWVEYAVYRGMDRGTAEDSTIAQLAECDYDTLFGPESKA